MPEIIMQVPQSQLKGCITSPVSFPQAEYASLFEFRSRINA